MASLDLGTLKISVEVNNAEAHQQLDATKEKVESTSSSLGTKLTNAAGVAKTAMVGFAGVATAVGAAAIKIATDTATAADEIDKMS